MGVRITRPEWLDKTAIVKVFHFLKGDRTVKRVVRVFIDKQPVMTEVLRRPTDTVTKTLAKFFAEHGLAFDFDREEGGVLPRQSKSNPDVFIAAIKAPIIRLMDVPAIRVKFPPFGDVNSTTYLAHIGYINPDEDPDARAAFDMPN